MWFSSSRCVTLSATLCARAASPRTAVRLGAMAVVAAACLVSIDGLRARQFEPGLPWRIAQSTVFGGSYPEVGNAVGVDSARNVYVAGFTQSATDYPTRLSLHQPDNVPPPPFVGRWGFLARFDSLGSLTFSTYLRRCLKGWPSMRSTTCI
jgi:hypothetical protein